MEALTIDLDDVVIKPITNKRDFEEAGALIDALVDSDMLEDDAERGKALALLDAITTLAVEYEKKHFPIPAPDPIVAIKERMEMLHLSQKDVAPFFGGANRVSEVLNRKRELSLSMIKKLYHGLGIPAEVLLAN